MIKKNALKSLAKRILIELGLTQAVSSTDSAIQRKIFVCDITTLIISNKEKEDIIKIVKSVKGCWFIDKIY